MKHDFELFSAVYGCYFTVVSKIVKEAAVGISRKDIDEMVNHHAFYESTFHLLPRLFSGEWDLLAHQADGKYYSKLKYAGTRPVTNLELAWIKSLLLDKRIHLFLDMDSLKALQQAVTDVPLLYQPQDFHFTDRASDGDPFEKQSYIENFRCVLKAVNEKKSVKMNYEGGRGVRSINHVLPYKINYSDKDDKFRLRGLIVQPSGKYQPVTLNMARILDVEESPMPFPENLEVADYFVDNGNTPPIVVEIYKERNAIERFMLQFASWEKHTEYDDERDIYTCTLYYDKPDETELLIRILSFGPVVKVIGPADFLWQIKQRISDQYEKNKAAKVNIDDL